MADEHRKTILVVDDEPDVTELVEYKLRQSGYTVRAVNDPLRAVGLARDLRPDVIVLDVMMPELDGIRLLRMIRADSLLKDTPVILLTARAASEDRVKGFETGADDYVPKPFEPRELLLRIQALLRRAKSAAAKPDTRIASGPVVLDVERHEVTVGGKAIELTATEFAPAPADRAQGPCADTRRPAFRRLELRRRAGNPHGGHARAPPSRETGRRLRNH